MSPPKQVILIMTDTQRPDMLGCYGNRSIKTPNLDHLAASGMRFDAAYCCQPVCGPARSALFTGLFPHSNGAWANSMPLSGNVKTIGERLGDLGFHTAYIGKWHLDGGDYFGLGRCPAGWDPEYWYDMRCYLEELSPDERLASRRTQTMYENGGISDAFTYAHRCSNRAIKYLESHADDPFLLVVSYDEPHGPSLAPEPYASMYDGFEWPKSANHWDDLKDKPEHQMVWAGEAIDRDVDTLTIKPKSFLGCHTFVDYEIGRVLDAIDRYAPGALVLYTSDHGEMFHSHRLVGKGPAMYEEIVRVPFIVRWPGNVAEGSSHRHPVSHVDVVPTIFDALELPPPQWVEGRSLLPSMCDPEVRVNDEIFMEFGRFEVDHDGFGGFQPIRCVFDGRYKLVINLLTSDELYDLETDPEEIENLVARQEYASIRDRLHDRLLDWMNRTRDPFRGYYWERRPWRRDAAPPTWEYTGYTRQREHEEYEPRQLDYSTGLPMEKAHRPKH